MAVGRVTTWISGQVLTASALNAEIDNLINNALTMISPLTGNIDFGNFRLDNLASGTVTTPAVNFSGDTNTGIYRVTGDAMGLAAGGVDAMRWTTATTAVNYLNVIPAAAATGPELAAAGSDANISLNLSPKGTGSVVVFTANSPFVPAAASGTPAQHALYRDNVVKGWLLANITGTILSDFNVASISDAGTGLIDIPWDRDFSTATYVAMPGVTITAVGAMTHVDSTTAQAAGSVRIHCLNTAAAAQDPELWHCIAVGDQ